MSNARKNYSGESYLTPFFKITLGGRPLSALEETLVEEIVYENNSTGSDLVTITINDPDYVFIGDKRLTKSTPCKVQAGYLTDYRLWIDGYVSAVDVDFPEEGFPVISIYVMDKSYIMNKVEHQRTFKNMTYTDIARAIAKKYGLSFEGDTTGLGGKKQESITQSYETDIQFLIGLADEIGYMVYVKGNKLYWKNQDTYIKKHSTWHTLWYRRPPFDIISFRPRIIEADQLDEISSSDIDSHTKKKTKASASKG